MKNFLPFILVLIFSFFTVAPLFHAGFFPVHDAAQPERILAMFQSLGSGQLPVRWVANFGYGYGYPLFNFYAPLAYYIGAFSMFLGLQVLPATKFVFGLGIVIAGIGMYLFAKEFWGKAGGILSALLYMYAPYHAVEAYVRGDLAELLAYGIIPLVFLSFYKLILSVSIENNVSVKRILLVSFAFAALILSHNLTAMMITPFLIAFLGIFIFYLKKISALRFTLYAFGLAFCLSAFYWVPVFAEMKYTNVLSQTGGGFDFHQNFVCWSQFWSSPWGYGGSVPGCTDGLSFMAGKVSILLALAGIVMGIFVKKSKEQSIVLWSGAAFAGIAFLLATDISKPIWDSIHVMSFFQFPWRFLVMISFFLSLLSGSVFAWIRRINILPVLIFYGVCIIGIVFIIVLQKKYFVPQTFISLPSSYYTNPITTQWELSRASSEYMPRGFSKPKTKQQLPGAQLMLQPQSGNIFVQKQGIDQLQAIVTVSQATLLHINIADFPAWHVFVDSREVSKKYSSTGFAVYIPSGEHRLDVQFIQTPVEIFANVLSLAGVLGVVIAIIFERYTKHEKTDR